MKLKLTTLCLTVVLALFSAKSALAQSPPFVNFTTPTMGASVIAGSTLDLGVTIASGVGVSFMTYTVDGSYLCMDTTAPYSCPWTVPSTVGIGHTLQAMVFDNNGAVGYGFALVTAIADNLSPSVSFTNPTNGANLQVGTSAFLSANAVDNIGVSIVDFLVDGSILCTSFNAPYFCLWNVPNSVSSHTLVARARDYSNNIQEHTISVNSVDTIAPSVSFTNPTNGANLQVGTSAFLSANAVDNIGVSIVDFLVDGSILCTSFNAPYFCLWNVPNSVSSHTLVARARDYSNNIQEHTISVNSVDTVAPSVSITSPTNGANLAVGSSVLFSATSSDNIGVTKVEFYVNGSLLCTDTAAPYSCNWSVPNTLASYTLMAKSYDTSSNMSQATISVNSVDTLAPLVSFTYPTNGGLIPRNSTITMTATATDNMSVADVKFYVNGVLKCTDSVAPYSCDWFVPKTKGVNYTFNAKATDNSGNIGQSTVTAKSY